MSGSSVPEAARAAARVSVANVVNDSWPLSGDQQIAVDVALMAAIPFIVAAAVAEERATTGRALARIKSERLGNRPTGPARDERMFNAGLDAAEAILRAALASPGEGTGERVVLTGATLDEVEAYLHAPRDARDETVAEVQP